MKKFSFICCFYSSCADINVATYHQYIAKLAQLQKPDQLTTAAESPAQLNSIMQVNGTDETEEIPMEALQNEKDEEKSDEVRIGSFLIKY